MSMRHAAGFMVLVFGVMACDDGGDPPGDPVPDARVRTIGIDMQVPDASPDMPPPPPPPPMLDAGPMPDAMPPDESCTDGAERPCPNSCGVERCVDGMWGACDAGGALEQCNGADDDCDGAIDESFRGLGIGCSVMMNGCNAQGLIVCDDAGTGTVCQPTEEVMPEAERCDGIDNDCDNEVDEDFPNELCCTEDFHCPDNAACVSGECIGGPDPEPDPLGGLDPALSCDAAIELNQFGRFEANTLFAAAALDGTCGGNGPEQVFWFEFAEATDVVLLTDGTDYDTVLHVRTDCEQPGSEVACDDDGGDGSASRVEVRAQANTRYYVVLDAFSLFGGGDAQLGFWPAGEVPECIADADCGPRATCEEAVCVPVPVVQCDDAVVIEPGVPAMGTTAGQPDALGAGCGTPTGGELVYRLRTARPGTIEATTSGSAFDTILSVRTVCADEMTELDCDDDGGEGNTSTVNFEVDADTDYFLIIDGYNGASGATVLDVSADLDCAEDAECGDGLRCIEGDCVPPPACEMPVLIEPGLHMGDTTDRPDTQNATCANASGGEVAYRIRFDAPTTVNARTDGSDFDTVLKVRTTCDDAESELVCDDDDGEGTRSLLEFDAEADTDYFIIVDGYNGASGAFTLDVRVPEPPPELVRCAEDMPCAEGNCLNGICVAALACMATPVSVGQAMGDTAGGMNTLTPGCQANSDAPEAVFAFVSEVDADITVNTEGTGFDTVLYVLDADCMTELACDDDGGLGTTSALTFRASAGQPYFIVVDGYLGNAGPFTLNVAAE